MAKLLWVMLGGGLGSGLRWLAAEYAERWAGSAVPGTLAVNLLGSFALALLMATLPEQMPAGPRLALTTGLLGGFTTYSTFNFEMLSQVEGGRWDTAAVYLITTVGLCLAGGFAGWKLGAALGG